MIIIFLPFDFSNMDAVQLNSLQERESDKPRGQFWEAIWCIEYLEQQCTINGADFKTVMKNEYRTNNLAHSFLAKIEVWHREMGCIKV